MASPPDICSVPPPSSPLFPLLNILYPQCPSHPTYRLPFFFDIPDIICISFICFYHWSPSTIMTPFAHCHVPTTKVVINIRYRPHPCGKSTPNPTRFHVVRFNGGDETRGRGKKKKRKREGGRRESAFYLECDVTTPRWSCELSQKVFWEGMAVAMATRPNGVPAKGNC